MRAFSLAPMLSSAALIVSGCATDGGNYPSLAPRPIEKQGFAEPVSQPVEAAADPALDAKLADMGRQFDTIARGFATDAAKAETAVGAAKGQPAGGERWIAAQTSLASLDDWRAQGSALLTDLEQLAIDRAATLAPDYPALGKLHDRVKTETDAEGATITRLSGSLPQA